MCEMPHGFHPLSWITPRKTGKSNAHDEEYVVVATMQFLALDAWALQNQADATVDSAHGNFAAACAELSAKRAGGLLADG